MWVTELRGGICEKFQSEYPSRETKLWGWKLCVRKKIINSKFIESSIKNSIVRRTNTIGKSNSYNKS